MPTLPTQKLTQFYEKYSDKHLTFNKGIITTTGLETKKVFIKIQSDYVPCVLFSSSMTNAKVVINLTSEEFEMIKRAKNIVNLRLGFFTKQMKKAISFFVPAVVEGYSNYNSSSDSSYLMSIKFTQKPADDYLEILGKVFETLDKFEQREELRIPFEQKVASQMGFTSNKAIAVIDNIKRNCIITNISATGCLIIMMCNPKFLMNKQVNIHISLPDSKYMNLVGVIVRTDSVEGRKDLYALGVEFDENNIPFAFKEMLNDYVLTLEEMAKNQIKK